MFKLTVNRCFENSEEWKYGHCFPHLQFVFALASLRLSSLKLRIETGRYPQNRIDKSPEKVSEL